MGVGIEMTEAVVVVVKAASWQHRIGVNYVTPQ